MDHIPTIDGNTLLSKGIGRWLDMWNNQVPSGWTIEDVIKEEVVVKDKNMRNTRII